MTFNLDEIKKRINELRVISRKSKYYLVPALWLCNSDNADKEHIAVNPFDFFLNQIDIIESYQTKEKSREATTQTLKSIREKKNRINGSVIYNLFIRYGAAYDHNGDGKIALKATTDGFRETGTFLKAIAMIPYIYSLGVNILYLLPIASIGIDSRKGTLGSPYSIKNPYKLDENLSEPVLNLGAEIEFKALVEAAHLLNIKVVLEFVFRTASLDSELALEHPEWFYWIKSSIHNRHENTVSEHFYGPPIFTESELKEIKLKVANKDFTNLPPPHKIYRDMFTDIPKKVAKVDGKLRGVLHNGTEVRIACAFADWPPDDKQPVWSDVTYLRLYNHKQFNYISYNTIRMYDNKLAKEKYEVKALWNNISEIIPYYQDNFKIDGVMIDMGHALPDKLRAEIISKARHKNPDFLFFEENFTLSKESVDAGYDAVVGYLPFDEHLASKLKSFISFLSNPGTPIPFFATPESHNTPRASSRPGGVEYSKLSWVINCFLPGIPFIHNGYELGDNNPVNTGLGFTSDEIKKYSAQHLPLFSESSLFWDSSVEWTDFLKYILSIRNKYLDIDNNIKRDTIIECKTSVESVAAFIRTTIQSNKYILIAGNISEQDKYFSIKLPFKPQSITDIIKGSTIRATTIEPVIYLQSFGFLLYELKEKI